MAFNFNGAPLDRFEAVLLLPGDHYRVMVTREGNPILVNGPTFMGTFDINGVPFVVTASAIQPAGAVHANDVDANDDDANDGPLNNGPINNGPINNGPINNGPINGVN